MTLEHSRALLLGQGVTHATPSELERRLEQAVTTITLNPAFPGAELAATVLLTTLRRLPGHLHLESAALPGTLVDRLVDAVSAVDPKRGLTITHSRPIEPTVQLHIGTDAPSGSIQVVPEGYGAHLAGPGHAPIRVRRPATALGAVYAAALGAAEVFKHTAGVLPARRVLHQYLRFCPVTLSTDLNRAPDLPDGLRLDLTLVGLGAVGTAIAQILSELPATGMLVLVDPERFEPENRGTYTLGGARETIDHPWKVDLAATVLTGYDVTRFHGDVERYLAVLEADGRPWPRIVLTGLDSIPARHAAQRLWPDRLIDAATGDTMLGLHDIAANGGPCMMCFLPATTGGPSSLDRLAKATGLRVEQLARGDEPLTATDLAQLGADQQERLRAHLGKPKCGLADALGLTTAQAEGYRPSVPFVSQQAACLAVGRLLAAILRLPCPVNLVQYDGLIGPQQATVERQPATATCYCQIRHATIEQVRALRRAPSAAG